MGQLFSYPPIVVERGVVMYYILLFLTILMWSFAGILVKSASMMVNTSVITLARFLFGIIFLGLFLFIRDKKIKVYWNNKWIWIGMAAKCCNYILENIAISIGYAYGNVVVPPIQAVFITTVSVIYFKEEIYRRKIIAVILCVVGVLFVSWNGTPLSNYYGTNFWVMILFVFGSIGAGLHLISQRMLIDKMDSANMNFSMFLLCTVFSIAPVPFTFSLRGDINASSVFSLIALGIITGLSFYMYAKVLKHIPFVVTAIMSNSCVLFSLLWSRLFFHEPITKYIIIGAVLFITGLIILNLPRGRAEYKVEEKADLNSGAGSAIETKN